MWLLFALGGALAYALQAVALKRSIRYAPDVVHSTVVFRSVAGLLLLGYLLASGGWPGATGGYLRVLAMVLPPEVAGMVLMAMALRLGDLSLVQPILGLIPVFVMLGGMAVLGEVPSAAAAGGIVLVTAGVYTVGLERGGSWLEPIRALARERASWYTLGAAICWSITTVLHKLGMEEVGALPWGVSVALGSAVLLGAGLPLLARRRGGGIPPVDRRRWGWLMAVAGIAYALHVAGIFASLRLAPAGYVIGVASTSTLITTAFAVLALGERDGIGSRVAGSALVTAGAVLIALVG